MINWFARLTGREDSRTRIEISGKPLEVLCSARANRALAARDRPLVAEVELAFACMARKQVLFHETAGATETIRAHDKLELLITTVIPNACEKSAATKTAAKASARHFTPKWIRIDYAKGKWIGEYGL